MLRQGGSPHRTLQEAWDRHGADAITFEVVEELPEDAGDFSRDRLLSERADDWREKLGAESI